MLGLDDPRQRRRDGRHPRWCWAGKGRRGARGAGTALQPGWRPLAAAGDVRPEPPDEAGLRGSLRANEGAGLRIGAGEIGGKARAEAVSPATSTLCPRGLPKRGGRGAGAGFNLICGKKWSVGHRQLSAVKNKCLYCLIS